LIFKFLDSKLDCVELQFDKKYYKCVVQLA
jgi:hypothetical protein